MAKSAMIGAILGRKKVDPVLELELPIFYAGLTVKAGEGGTYTASVAPEEELPKDIEGKTLYLQGGEEGIEISVLGLPDAKSIEFIYDGSIDITGLQDFFLVKEYKVMPLSAWSAPARSKWHAAKAEIEAIKYRLSPLALLSDALNGLYLSKRVCENDLAQRGENRMAGDAVFDEKISRKNLEVVAKSIELSQPLVEYLSQYELLPSATLDQANALMVEPRIAIIELGLGLKTPEEFASIAALDELIIEQLSDQIDAAIEKSVNANETSLADDLINKDDLSPEAQPDNKEGKPLGGSISEPWNRSDGVSDEQSELEPSPTIEH